MTPDEIIDIARTWIGVPFRHQGRSRLGVDCAGFVESLLRECRALPADYQAPRAYGKRSTPELRAVVEQYCERVPGRVAESAMLVLIQWPKSPHPSHVALCTGSNIIHAYAHVRRVVENGYREPWLRLTHSVWRMPGIDYGS